MSRRTYQPFYRMHVLLLAAVLVENRLGYVDPTLIQSVYGNTLPTSLKPSTAVFSLRYSTIVPRGSKCSTLGGGSNRIGILTTHPIFTALGTWRNLHQHLLHPSSSPLLDCVSPSPRRPMNR